MAKYGKIIVQIFKQMVKTTGLTFNLIKSGKKYQTKGVIL